MRGNRGNRNGYPMSVRIKYIGPTPGQKRQILEQQLEVCLEKLEDIKEQSDDAAIVRLAHAALTHCKHLETSWMGVKLNG